MGATYLEITVEVMDVEHSQERTVLDKFSQLVKDNESIRNLEKSGHKSQVLAEMKERMCSAGKKQRSQ